MTVTKVKPNAAIESIDARIAGAHAHLAAKTQHPDVCWRAIDKLLDQRMELMGRDTSGPGWPD